MFLYIFPVPLFFYQNKNRNRNKMKQNIFILLFLKISSNYTRYLWAGKTRELQHLYAEVSFSAGVR